VPFRVDLRSDTVTKPSAAMRRAMADAEVGDAWYGDDPTVARLQEAAAEITGKEASLFVATGTMANQIGLRLHFQGVGHLIAAERRSHVATVEVMTSAALAGIAYRMGDSPKGWVTAELAEELLGVDTFYRVEVVDLLAVENTAMAAGGRVMPSAEMAAIASLAERAGAKIHMDGARIFNAAAATGQPVSAWAQHADTVMFCLSKGLGAPVGSLICGPTSMVAEARRLWILYGGAWRQAGVIAAAGLVALRDGPGRLEEDHARARALAAGVADALPGSTEPEEVETNIVFVDTESLGLPTLEAIERLAALGVGATHAGGKVRMVTHVDVDDDGLDAALDAWRTIAKEV
jgi:threonine aldolase